jgi:hypothetical protein
MSFCSLPTFTGFNESLFMKNKEWFQKNKEMLMKIHPDSYVLIDEEKVQASCNRCIMHLKQENENRVNCFIAVIGMPPNVQFFSNSLGF